MVDGLRARADQDGLIALNPPPKTNGWRRGDRVFVTEGPFAELTGFYQGQSAHERVRILLSILGSDREVEMPRDHIARGRRPRRCLDPRTGRYRWMEATYEEQGNHASQGAAEERPA